MGPAHQQHWRIFCAAPCEENFDPIYSLTRRLAWAVCRRILPDGGDALEAFHAAYRQILIEAPSLAHHDLYAVAYRLVVAEARRIRRRRPWHGSADGAAAGGEPGAADAAAEKVRARLQALLSEAPLEYRVPMLLHYFHGMSDWEIAQGLDKPERKILRALFEGRRRMGPVFKREGFDADAPWLESVFAPPRAASPPADLTAGLIYAKAQAAMLARASAPPLPAGASLGRWITGGVSIVFLCAVLLGDRSARLLSAAGRAEAGVAPLTIGAGGFPVTFAQFSPGGDRVLTAADDGMGRLYDSRSGAMLAALSGPAGQVLGAYFDADRILLVTATAGGLARVWEGATGRELAAMGGHEGGVRRAEFDPGGRRLITVSTSGVATLWDLEGGRRIASFEEGAAGGAIGVRFSPDGRHILTTRGGAATRLWDAMTGRETAALRPR